MKWHVFLKVVLLNCVFFANGYAEDPVLEEKDRGLYGYINASISSAPNENYNFGFSFYVPIWSLLKNPIANFQIGLPSTWILPQNDDFKQPLCPVGTISRDHLPEFGPYYQDAFQTIEGGAGFWRSTQFASSIPKYRINSTPDCYNTEISSPGWGFGQTTALAPNLMGIAQLSNRILIPADGLTFDSATNGEVLGTAWMNLPIMPARPFPRPFPAGGNNWTLFMNAANFSGPVAFYIPATWSRLSTRYSVVQDRGLDVRPAKMSGGAMEVNSVPYFESKDHSGVIYSRIPQLQFPVDEQNNTILMQGIYFYSEEAIYKPLKIALEEGGSIPTTFIIHSGGAWAPRCIAEPFSFVQEGKIPLTGISNTIKTIAFQQNGECYFGLHWNESSNGMGYFPNYFKQMGGERIALNEKEVPVETALQKQTFSPPTPATPYKIPNLPIYRYYWVPLSKPSSLTVKLSDGSIITYRWYRFIDQPSLQHLRQVLTVKEAEDLQAKVVALHKGWAGNTHFMPEPSIKNKLVKMDKGLLVTPPPGFEFGYVPIVASQEGAQTFNSALAF